MNKKLKWFLLAAALGLAVLVCHFGYFTWRRLQFFGDEDTIMGSYYPVVEALRAYGDKSNQPPRELSQLVPAFMDRLPRLDFIQKTEYQVEPDGKNWRLALYTQAHGAARIYCYRSDDSYAPAEKKRIILIYHGGWTVLRNP
ncbi:MAG: hypothetical protein NTV49_16480 [Kiritimatiellaeota bacterium]|nr:hypothetical protein [Kiritimatiellota bacterium]